MKAFGEDEERGSQAREKAAIAAVLVHKNGVLVEENSIAVSSFAWALPLALKLNLGALGAWPKIEPKIIENLDDILRREDEDGTPIPLDLPTIEKAHRWLVMQFGLRNDLVEAPTFALRVYHYFKAKNPPEVMPLNSFFLGDLARGSSLVSKGNGPIGLQCYLGIKKPTETFDLFADRAALERAVALMDVFSGGPPQDEEKWKLLGDLWSTLFMVVPVLSTTFASVERMLGDLPAGSIGWLLIDEAGQALPQAAVGAVMRAKRSIVVGDPLQIPPVVTLQERLNSEICKFFKVDKPIWAAPEASAQTLTDRASQFQAAFRSDLGSRRVGIPLLVHRRCQEPMFGISNRIAYDGHMVHAPGPGNAGTIGAALGSSAWLDIDGEADSKWCPAEGELVVNLLQKIASAAAR